MFWLALFATTTGVASPAETYDANHDDKLGAPTQQQTEKALEAGDKFQEQQRLSTPAGSPVTAIPESYTAETELYPASPPAEEVYDGYHWRWGPRVFWPCERFDPFQRFSLYLWSDRHHDRDDDHDPDVFDMWCPPYYDRITRRRHRGSGP